jgi:hypothetical protein
MPEPSAIEKLSALLQSSQAQPRLHTERVVPSATYDLDYRVFVIAAAFEIHAKDAPPIARRIRATKLQLLQFIAIRPRLLGVIRRWSAAADDEDNTFDAHDLRRGFLGDRMFDSVVTFLVARGALEWMGGHLAAGSNAALLSNIYQGAVASDLFASERQVLTDLAAVRVTVSMLEGM